MKKPFPTGMVLGSTVLAAFLIFIIAYSAVNVGAADTASLKHAEKSISGLHSHHGLSRVHLDNTLIGYPDQSVSPPYGGNHNPTPQSCQVYTTPIANPHAVHSLEHGAVWATYNPKTATKADIATLTKDVTGNPFRMLSPYPNLKSPVSLQAWGEQLFVKSASDSRVAKFFRTFTSGPQTPETGVECVGTTASAADSGLTTGNASWDSGTEVSQTDSPAPVATPTVATPTATPTKKVTPTATPTAK